MTAALCMVLYGYDAFVFNSVQGSPNWRDWVNLDVEEDTQMLGLSKSKVPVQALCYSWCMLCK